MSPCAAGHIRRAGDRHTFSPMLQVLLHATPYIMQADSILSCRKQTVALHDQSGRIAIVFDPFTNRVEQTTTIPWGIKKNPSTLSLPHDDAQTLPMSSSHAATSQGVRGGLQMGRTRTGTPSRSGPRRGVVVDQDTSNTRNIPKHLSRIIAHSFRASSAVQVMPVHKNPAPVLTGRTGCAKPFGHLDIADFSASSPRKLLPDIALVFTVPPTESTTTTWARLHPALLRSSHLPLLVPLPPCSGEPWGAA